MLGRMNWKVILMFLVCTAAIWYIAPAILPKVRAGKTQRGKGSSFAYDSFRNFGRQDSRAGSRRPLQGFGTATYPVVSEGTAGRISWPTIPM